MAGPYDGWTEEPAAPAQPAIPNTYAGWTEQSPADADEDRKDAQVLRTFEATFGGNVERKAQVARLAEETGLDAGLVDRQFDALQKSVGAGKFDARKWRRENPALADLVLKRPELGPVAMGDETVANFFGEDSLRMLGGGALKGVGSLLRGVQTGVELSPPMAATARLRREVFGRVRPLDGIADWFKEQGESVQEGVSAETRKEIAGSTPGGNLLDPESWSFGEDPTFTGYAMQALDVAGGMLPLFAASLATGGSALAGGVVGGLQGGGAAEEQARSFVRQMAESGQIEKESEVYRSLRAEGLSHAEAVEGTADRAADLAFILTAPVAGAGGAFTSKVINPLEGFVGKTLAGKVAGRVGLGALEEGSQEAAESIATNLGMEMGTGADVPVFEGTFSDFLLGAIGGAGAGSVGTTGDIAGAFAERRTARARALLEKGGESPLAKASPQAFAEWAEAEGKRRGEELTAIYVDPEAVMKLNQDPVQAEQTARELFGDDGAEKLREALARGTKIEVPIAVAVERTAAHPLAGSLLDHVASQPGDFTQAERKTKAAELEAQQRALVEEFETQEIPAESEAEAAFLATLEGQLAATGVNDKKAAKHGVALWRAFVRTQAQRMGVAQDELFDRYTLAVERGAAVPAEMSAAAQTQAAPSAAPRGFMERFGDSFRIVLNKNADLSTFLHETGHVHLEMFGDLAADAAAPQQVRDDYAALLEWFGVKDRASIGREHHEKFARGFELYLREGKAPSPKLEGAFTRFRLWLKNIYKQASALNVELSDEVRGVFDRMLATDAEIARAKQRAGIPAKPPRLPGQSEADYTALTAAQERAERAANKAATLRALELKQRETESWWKEQKANFHAEAAEEYDSLPATRAVRYVKNSEVEGVKLDPPVRLDRAEVEALIGKEAAKPLNHVITKKGGQRLQDVAAELGYANGRELLGTVLNHPTREQYADEVANRRMAQEHGDVATERRELAKKIDEVLHSEVGLEDAYLKEYLTLTAEVGGNHPAVEAIKRSAADIAANRAIGKINPARVLNDEQRANQRYLAAMAKKDYRAAVRFKREALVNHFLYRELVKAERAVERFEEDVARLNDNKRRAAVGLASTELRDMTDGLLIRLGLRAPDADVPSFPGAGALAGLLDGLGVPPVFDQQALTEIIFRRTDPRTITVSEMAVLHEALQQIKKAGTAAAEMFVNEKRRNYRELADLIAEEASTRPDLGLAPKDEAFEHEERQGRLTAQGLISGYTQIEIIFEKLGPTMHAVYRRFLDAQRLERELGAKIATKFQKHWDALPKAMQERRYETVDSSSLPVASKTRRDETPTTREWMWMVFLNWGNNGNRQRLLDGYGWSEEQVVRFLEANLTKEEATFLQGVLDVTNDLKPHTERIFERIHGLKPGSVRARPIALNLGGETVTLGGGYFPAKYDSQGRDPSGVLGRKQEEAGIQDARGSAAASVAKGFTKGRAGRFVGVINLDWSVVPAHLSQVIHYVAYEEYVRDFNRLIALDTFKETVERRLGKPYLTRLEEWIKTVAAGRDESVTGWTGEILGKAGKARGRFMASALAFNLKSVLADPLGVLNPWISGAVSGRSLSEALRNGSPRKYLRLRQEALAASPELQKRAENLRDTLQHKAAEIGKRGNKGKPRKGVRGAVQKAHAPVQAFEEWFREHGFILQEETDAYVSTLVWDAARRDYLRGVEKREGKAGITAAEEAKALQHADDVLRQHQPPATLLEQSAMLRDRKGVGSLLAMFGYFSQLGNMGLRMVGNAETRADKTRAFGRWYAILLVSNLLGSFITGGGPEDDESWAEWTIRKALTAPLMVVPFVSALGEEVVNRLTSLAFHGEAKRRRFSFMTSPVLAAAERTYNALGAAAASDEPEAKVGALLEAYGIVAGLPVTQGKRSGVALWNMITGETEPRDPLDAADKLLYGDSKYRGASPLSVGSDIISGEE